MHFSPAPKVFVLEGGLENPKKEWKLEKKVLENFISVTDGAEKWTKTRQRWKNARKVPCICCVLLQMSGTCNLLAFFHLSLVSVFFSTPSLTEMKLYRNFFRMSTCKVCLEVTGSYLWVCVWLKFKWVFSTHSSPALKCSSPAQNAFIFYLEVALETSQKQQKPGKKVPIKLNFK